MYFALFTSKESVREPILSLPKRWVRRMSFYCDRINVLYINAAGLDMPTPNSHPVIHFRTRMRGYVAVCLFDFFIHSESSP